MCIDIFELFYNVLFFGSIVLKYLDYTNVFYYYTKAFCLVALNYLGYSFGDINLYWLLVTTLVYIDLFVVFVFFILAKIDLNFSNIFSR